MSSQRYFRDTFLVCVGSALLAFSVPSFADTTPDSVARLALDVTRAEDIRAVKRLQMSYAQYAQFGLWNEMSSLFVSNAEAIYGADDLKGRAAIHAYYLSNWGGGREGLVPGGLHTSFDDTPVVNLSADGKTAQGRWHEFSMLGAYGGQASFAGGIMENDYVKEAGVWKISRIHYYPVFAGPYETGWKNVAQEIKIAPYHYTAHEAGVPIPPLPGDARIPAVKGGMAAIPAINQRIANLVETDKVANLQNAFGYYVDRKMWDDAADLFTDDAVLEIADTGIYWGARSIRRSFEKDGPTGLLRGQLNDRPMFDMTVWVSPDGNEARTRGTEFEMLGDSSSGNASLGLSVFENRFVRSADNKWRIREMRLFPIMATDYYAGWAKSRLAATVPTGTVAPDRQVPADDTGTLTQGAIPAFILPNPVTGKAVMLPKGSKIVAADSLLPAPTMASAAPSASTSGDPVGDAERRLATVTAYDGAENITHAFANYIDNSQWHEEGLLFADDGWRSKFAVAFCVGPEHVERCEREYDGDAPVPRLQQEIHWLSQPVITVADDGKSTTMRNRLLRYSTGNNEGGLFNNGIYPDNAARLVDGVWKLEVMAIDEPYFISEIWSDGWARLGHSAARHTVIVSNVTGRLPAAQRIKADVPRANMKIRYHGWLPGDTISWPDIKPMWFSYKNPVSGRLPEFYCSDMKTCERQLESQQ